MTLPIRVPIPTAGATRHSAPSGGNFASNLVVSASQRKFCRIERKSSLTASRPITAAAVSMPPRSSAMPKS